MQVSQNVIKFNSKGRSENTHTPNRQICIIKIETWPFTHRAITLAHRIKCVNTAAKPNTQKQKIENSVITGEWHQRQHKTKQNKKSSKQFDVWLQSVLCVCVSSFLCSSFFFLSRIHFTVFHDIMPIGNSIGAKAYEMEAQCKKCTQNYKCTDHFDRICIEKPKQQEWETKKGIAVWCHSACTKSQAIASRYWSIIFSLYCVTHLNRMDNVLLRKGIRLIGLSDSLGRVSFCLVRVRAPLRELYCHEKIWL